MRAPYRDAMQCKMDVIRSQRPCSSVRNVTFRIRALGPIKPGALPLQVGRNIIKKASHQFEGGGIQIISFDVGFIFLSL